MPNDSAKRTRSGLPKSVPKWRPNRFSCFHAMEPNPPSSQTTLTTAVPSRTAVSSSCAFIMNPPSPLTATTLRSGWTSFVAMAAGRAKPIAARPFEMRTVSGS